MTEQNATPPADTAADEARREKLRAQLAKGKEKMAEMRAAGWKPVVKNPVEQAEANPNSVKTAVKAFCWVCVGANKDPGAKFRVRDCTVLKCPLYRHRPWQNVKGGALAVDEDGQAMGNDDSEDTNDD